MPGNVESLDYFHHLTLYRETPKSANRAARKSSTNSRSVSLAASLLGLMPTREMNTHVRSQIGSDIITEAEGRKSRPRQLGDGGKKIKEIGICQDTVASRLQLLGQDEHKLDVRSDPDTQHALA